MRQTNETLLSSLFSQFPSQPSITQTTFSITSYDGATIELIRFSPAHLSPPTQDDAQPVILHFHGGGHCANTVSLFAPCISELAALSGTQIFSVEYRLAPEHPFPAALEDGYAALTYLSSQAESLNIDPARIGIMGESSGGGLAAGIALLARDRGFSPSLKSQILLYPMLDDRSITQNPYWDPDNSTVRLLTLCWQSYVGEHKAGRPDADVSPYAAPPRAKDLSGLPSTQIVVGGLDEFRDECAGFAGRLAAAGNDIEFYLEKGVPHGFDVAREIGVTKRVTEGRVRAIREV